MHDPHFLFQPQPLRPKGRFHHLVINILGKSGASGNNYSIIYGRKCTLCPHKNTRMDKHIYINMIYSSSLPRSGYSHTFNTTGVSTECVGWRGELLHLEYSRCWLSLLAKFVVYIFLYNISDNCACFSIGLHQIKEM